MSGDRSSSDFRLKYSRVQEIWQRTPHLSRGILLQETCRPCCGKQQRFCLLPIATTVAVSF